ncbi:unnamed protein product [marine sediment metagenome]|uniref:DUF7352 domain-containing protein n=1 Tax=marine sediment metagenome TaxID=412755 RepID=X1H052_9ZZZZ
MRIWKWPLQTEGAFELEMPLGATALTVQMQGEQACLWALVEEGRPKEIRRFRMYGTGHPILCPPGAYVGTFQLLGGAFVGHLFEEAA